MSGLQSKRKICSGCGRTTFIWKSNPPRCKDCCGREKEASLKGLPQPIIRKSFIKQKPKARVNGKPAYVALYMACFGYGDADFIPSEISGDRAVDVHHLICRGSGGTKTEDRIENLIGLTREEHSEYGDKKQHMAMLFTAHRDFMEKCGVKFDRNWMQEQITKYLQE